MKTFGWICIALGGLSFIGAAGTGRSIAGPAFWLAVGIALLYFGDKKDRK